MAQQEKAQCQIDGCSKVSWETGVCRNHYEYRRRRRLDPLIGTRKPGPKPRRTADERKEMNSEYARKWRQENPEKYRAQIINRHKEAREFVNSLKERPCADCGVQYAPYVMQFDHLPGHKKDFTIGTHRTKPADVIIAEAQKCDVVCANCHAVRTWQRRNNK